MIGVRLVIFFRMRHEKSDLAHHLLHGAVRVIEKRAFLVHGEFVDIFLAWRDRLLADVRHAVLLDGYFQTMPVQGSRLRQAVLEDHTYAIALRHLNRRTGAASVVTPRVDGLERRARSLHRFADEVENLYASIHSVGPGRHRLGTHRG